MRLFLLGGTRGTGAQMLQQALARGHQVTALVRSPQKISTRNANLTVIPGDALDGDKLKEALPGHDAVLSALGHAKGSPSTILGDAARLTVAAMKATGVPRLLVVSVAFLFPESGFAGALLRNIILRSNSADSQQMERVVSSSGLKWTIVRPPRLTNGSRTGKVRVEDGHLPGSVISRADVAWFMLNETEHPAHVGKIVGVCHQPGEVFRGAEASSDVSVQSRQGFRP